MLNCLDTMRGLAIKYLNDEATALELKPLKKELVKKFKAAVKGAPVRKRPAAARKRPAAAAASVASAGGSQGSQPQSRRRVEKQKQEIGRAHV